MEILVPISIGELYDKFSILQIKLDRIEDAEKLKNIEKEIGLLRDIANDNPIDKTFWYNLLGANAHLWEQEDLIRLKESKREFDEEFTDIAKEIYHTNDRRFAIKKQINETYKSGIVEEKSYEKYV